MIFGNFYLVYDVDYAENMKKIITKINNSNECGKRRNKIGIFKMRIFRAT